MTEIIKNVEVGTMFITDFFKMPDEVVDADRYECLLPTEMYPSKEAFESIGFEFKDFNGVLYRAKLPKGWRVESNGCWTTFIDSNEKERGVSHYKDHMCQRIATMRLYPN